jgi:hypothetical protein
VPLDSVVPTLTQVGISEDVARQYREMVEAVGRGLWKWEGGRARAARGKITLENFARAALSH